MKNFTKYVIAPFAFITGLVAISSIAIIKAIEENYDKDKFYE
nr:MAG TPA: hypothetical protein [Caudoviricetes sp.]